MTPLVSILIPAYNAERFIEETIESAIGQTYSRVEVILVNDGSTDRTLQLASRYQSPSFKVVEQSNAGGPAARNTALRHAQGDYFQWLDHDDVLHPRKVAEQMQLAGRLDDDRILFSSKSGTFFYRPEKARFSPNGLWKDLTPRDYFFEKFGQDKWLQTSAWLVSRRISESAGPWWENRSADDDGEYFCRVVKACGAIRFVPEAESYWRVANPLSFSNSRSRSRAAMEALLASTFRCIEHFLDFEDSAASRAACVTFLKNRLIYFYPEQPELLERIYMRARELGGSLSEPPLLWQYDLLNRLFGWRTARAANNFIPAFKTGLLSSWDKFMCRRASLSRNVVRKCAS